MALVLHDIDFDEDSYKVRLLLGLLGVDYSRVVGDGRADPCSGPGLDAEDSGIPCLVDGDTVVREAEAILAYLARRYDWRDAWLPADDPSLFGQTMTWLAFSARRLRAVGVVDRLFDIAPDDPETLQSAHGAFGRLESHLSARASDAGLWCVGRSPTIADVAAFAALALSAQAGADLSPYPATRNWMTAIRALPGFVAVPAVPSIVDENRLLPQRRLPRSVPHFRAGNVFVLTPAKRRPANSAA